MQRDSIKKAIRRDELFRSLATASKGLKKDKTRVRDTRWVILIGLSLEGNKKERRSSRDS